VGSLDLKRIVVLETTRLVAHDPAAIPGNRLAVLEHVVKAAIVEERNVVLPLVDKVLTPDPYQVALPRRVVTGELDLPAVDVVRLAGKNLLAPHVDTLGTGEVLQVHVAKDQPIAGLEFQSDLGLELLTKIARNGVDVEVVLARAVFQIEHAVAEGHRSPEPALVACHPIAARNQLSLVEDVIAHLVGRTKLRREDPAADRNAPGHRLGAQDRDAERQEQHDQRHVTTANTNP